MIILRMYQDFSPYSVAYQNLNKIVFFVFSILFILLCGTNKIQSQEKPFVVVLDAGHGGHDSGNRGNGYYEKNIALSIALKIGKTLEKTKGFKHIHAIGQIEEENSHKNAYVCFGPDYAPMEQTQIEHAVFELREIFDEECVLIFCAFHFRIHYRVRLLHSVQRPGFRTGELSKETPLNPRPVVM